MILPSTLNTGLLLLTLSATSTFAAPAISSVATSASIASATAVSSSVVSASTSTVTATTGTSAADDEQSATTLDPAVIATGFAQDGQQNATEGQVPSLTSTNNFINFCLTVQKPITNGQQFTTGSCNPAPMGVIAAKTNIPSSKFVFPKNGDTIKADSPFTVQMAVNNLETGNFVNEETNYLAAPQQVNAQGNIIGHSRIVIEQLDSLDQATPTDPNRFAFFKGISAPAVNGVLSADITTGLPAGVYRLTSFNSAANQQPALVAIAQHGSLDDTVYFTVE
ncbi:hypothetical protein A7U60_g6876 [Sanghuangporus baumii]|uniref:Uncharacterized protein n=1 Tax=Sanghuangporus baumii TaxID=108892 RepID=A0A9Q5N5X1_SANBA|nr:hypothetical protein A7U60_g6876 [Sanghuangporus baumii]